MTKLEELNVELRVLQEFRRWMESALGGRVMYSVKSEMSDRNRVVTQLHDRISTIRTQIATATKAAQGKPNNGEWKAIL